MASYNDSLTDLALGSDGNFYGIYAIDPSGYVYKLGAGAATGNRAPVAVNDRYTVENNGIFDFYSPDMGVLANDTDPDGNSLVVADTLGPGTGGVKTFSFPWGVVTFYYDGHFVFHPANRYVHGIHTFTYQAVDSQGLASNVATVTLNILRPPVLNKDKATTKAGVPVTIDVLANDKAFDSAALDPTSVTIIDGSYQGSVLVSVGGTVTYTPDANAGGTDIITYNVKDSNGLASIVGGVIEINLVHAVDDNYTVTATGLNSQTGTFAWRRSISMNDVPVAKGCTFTLVDAPKKVSGDDDGRFTITAFNPANGNFTYQLNGEGNTAASRKEAKRGVYELTYTMNLNGVTSASAKVTITVQ